MESERSQSLLLRVYLPPSLKAKIRTMAFEEYRSFAAMAGILLREAVTARSSA